jgi:hypothetical protein
LPPGLAGSPAYFAAALGFGRSSTTIVQIHTHSLVHQAFIHFRSENLVPEHYFSNLITLHRKNRYSWHPFQSPFLSLSKLIALSRTLG